MCKKIIFLSLAALMLFIGGTVFAQTMVTLDQAISYSANEIESRLAQGVKVMVLNFKSPSERLSNYVLDEMTNMLIRSGRLTTVDRTDLEFLLRELKYERSGDISDDIAQPIGRILGAQYVVSGVIEEFSANYVVQFKIMTVEPAALQTLTRVGVEKDAQIADLISPDTSSLKAADTSGSTTAGASSLTASGTSNVMVSDTSNAGVAQEYTSNVRKNWISGEVNIFIGGLRYERMLGPKLSLGVNAYWSSFLILLNELGIDASVRFYPWGRTFFVGAGLGYHQHTGMMIVGDFLGLNGAAITPEVGWKIDVGNEGAFFLQPGVKVPITFGAEKSVLTGNNQLAVGIALPFPVVYFGMGYAF